MSIQERKICEHKKVEEIYDPINSYFGFRTICKECKQTLSEVYESEPVVDPEVERDKEMREAFMAGEIDEFGDAI